MASQLDCLRCRNSFSRFIRFYRVKSTGHAGGTLVEKRITTARAAADRPPAHRRTAGVAHWWGHCCTLLDRARVLSFFKDLARIMKCLLLVVQGRWSLGINGPCSILLLLCAPISGLVFVQHASKSKHCSLRCTFWSSGAP